MIQKGIKGRAEDAVVLSNTAQEVGSGLLPVFATPSMIAMMEKAASTSIAPFLEDGQSSVGTKIEISHLSATPVGLKVWAESEVTDVDKRRVVFNVKAYDEKGLIGEGTHERFIIDVDRFMAKTLSKKD